jgi:aldehyde:ferredoxin oxidoreductase
MECFEKGLLTLKDTDGLELKWGNSESMLTAIELLAKREGFGDFLAEGTARMADKIGRGSIDFAMQVKGVETSMHEPRIKANIAFGYMLSPEGADHCGASSDGAISIDKGMGNYHSLGFHAPFTLNEISARKMAFYKVDACNYASIDSLVLCMFVGYGPEGNAELLKAVTGWDTGPAELIRIGERILTTMRSFNIREGLTAADDVLPKRFFESKTDGVVSNTHLEHANIDQVKRYFYALMGWDVNGIPLPEKIEELDIE